MVESNLFHGTYRKRGESFLSNKQMETSRGDKHWLGDGSYFFEEDFYAYKWIYDMFKKHFKRNPNDDNELNNFYGIILGNMKVEKERIFDLDKIEHKIEYDKIYSRCKKLSEYSKRLNKVEFSEGVIINIMFEKMNYGKNYSVVQATFSMRHKRYSEVKMRLTSLPQKQICFKDLSCIEPLDFYDFAQNISKYKTLMQEYSKNILAQYTTKNIYSYKQ